jgi:hypothetical protein
MLTIGPVIVHSVVIRLTGDRSRLIFRLFSSVEFSMRKPPKKWSDYHYFPCLEFIENVEKIVIEQKWKSLGNEIFRDYMIGRLVRKSFAAPVGKKKKKWHVGRVQAYDFEYDLYRIVFFDGDPCEMDKVELNASLMGK